MRAPVASPFVTLVAASLLAAGRARAQEPPAPEELVWTTESRDASGSMPIGNGEVGLNVWCEPGGRLCFYVSRTDSFSEASRLLKLGKVVLSVRAPVAGEPFEQRLDTEAGCIRVTWGAGERRVAVTLFVDAGADLVHVLGECGRDEEATLSAESWRTADKRLTGAELSSSWTMRDAPADVVASEAADRGVEIRREPPILGFFHRNESSVVPSTLARQGLSGAGAPPEYDPLLHRTFGLAIAGTGATRGAMRDPLHPVLIAPRGRRFRFQIAAPCLQVSDEGGFARLAASLLDAVAGAHAQELAASWWRSFWSRSSIVVGGGAGSPGARLTQALRLQRFVQACGGRGRFPIKFNGSIFTVEPKFTGGPDLNADWRKWGDCFWWQNTRLPYHPMLAQGDFELQEPLFRLFLDTLPLARERVRAWYGGKFSGAYWPETMTPFGTHSNGDYGWKRDDLPSSKVLCPWWEYARNQGPELLALMLDRFDYEGEPGFVTKELLPLAEPILDWFATAYPRDDHGTLMLTPTQAVETYWTGVQDDMPTVAGLHCVLPRLLALPRDLLPDALAAKWRALGRALPPIPQHTVDGVPMLAPAARFDPQRSNCESPELYAVFPFRLFALGRPGLALARAAYDHRVDRFTNGWPQDGQDAALLGLVGDAQKNVLAKLDNSNPGHRFPVMWGPNFDWCPDQDHGSNLLDTTERMLLQCDGDAIRVLPCWPKEWDVSYKLHAPQNTTVEVVWKDEKLERCVVTPAARQKDVIVGR